MKRIKSSMLIYVICCTITAAASVLIILVFYQMKPNNIVGEETHNSANVQKDYSAQGEVLPDNQEYFTTEQSNSQETQEVDGLVSPSHLYVVTISGDAVVVYMSGRDVPYIKFFVDLKNMPKEDISLLKKGIYADSRAELIKILEDYDG